jgi:hypothetical protein
VKKYHQIFKLWRSDCYKCSRFELKGILIEYGKRRLNQNAQKPKNVDSEMEPASKVSSTVCNENAPTSKPLSTKSALDIEMGLNTFLNNRARKFHRTDMLGFPSTSIVPATYSCYVPNSYPETEIDNLMKRKNLKIRIKEVLNDL